MARIEESQLGSLSLLRADDAVRVYRTDFLPPGLTSPAIYTKFAGDRFARARAVSAVTGFRDKLASQDREYLDQCFRWPRDLVCDRRDVLGFLVPALPGPFTMVGTGGLLLARTLDWLAAEAVPVADRVTLLGQVCGAVAFLHERGWVFGNLSARTMAFALDPLQAMLLDCDGAASLADSDRFQAHALGWAPPEVLAPQDERTDVYKLGLAIVAALGPVAQGTPVADSARLRGVLDPLGVALVGRALSADRSVRPTALELAAHLRQAGTQPAPPAPVTEPAPAREPAPPTVPPHPPTVTSHPGPVAPYPPTVRVPAPEPGSAPLRLGDPVAVGKYRLLGRLGEGGMGTVFLGASPGGRRVAVKLVRTDLTDEPGFRRRFAREVAAARLVNGFYTAQVLDADDAADPPWLATAHVPGPTLAAAIRERGPMLAAEVRSLGAALAEGLAEIHRCRLVHRDLKPSNVIMAPDGPRIIDFGIARDLDATSSLTATGSVIGTFAYMSPEQVAGKPVGTESDVFSLGSVLTYAATGHAPFDISYPAVLIHITTEPADLADLPAELADVIPACLEKDPARRPSVADLIRRLGSVG